MGSALYSGPFLSTAVMAAIALLESGRRGRPSALHLPGIAAGTGRGWRWRSTSREQSGFDPQHIAARAGDEGSATFLEGVKDAVVDGGAGRFDCWSSHETTVASVCSTLRQMRRDSSARRSHPSTPPGSWPASASPGRRPYAIRADEAAIGRSYDRIVAALASEQVGGAQRCLDMAVEYARERIQFGRPIGSFQAIKHICADLLLDVEAAKSAARHAAACVDERTGRAGRSQRAWPSRSARRPMPAPRRRTCRSTAGSVSPGSMPATCT